MANLIKYEKYTPEAADDEQKQLGGSNVFVKLEVGKNRLRVLPAPAGQRSPFKVVRQHGVEVPGEQYPVRFECLGKDCPACAEESRLSRTGNPKDRDRSYSMRAKPRIFCTAVDRKNEADGPKLWEFGKQIHEQLTKLLKNEDAGGDFTDPYDGFDVLVDREGTGMDTSYTVFPARQSTPLNDDEQLAAEWCETRPDVEKYARIMSIEEVKALLDGESPKEKAARESKKQLPARGGSSSGGSKRRTAQDDLE